MENCILWKKNVLQDFVQKGICFEAPPKASTLFHIVLELFLRAW